MTYEWIPHLAATRPDATAGALHEYHDRTKRGIEGAGQGSKQRASSLVSYEDGQIRNSLSRWAQAGESRRGLPCLRVVAGLCVSARVQSHMAVRCYGQEPSDKELGELSVDCIRQAHDAMVTILQEYGSEAP